MEPDLFKSWGVDAYACYSLRKTLTQLTNTIKSVSFLDEVLTALIGRLLGVKRRLFRLYALSEPTVVMLERSASNRWQREKSLSALVSLKIQNSLKTVSNRYSVFSEANERPSCVSSCKRRLSTLIESLVVTISKYCGMQGKVYFSTIVGPPGVSTFRYMTYYVSKHLVLILVSYRISPKKAKHIALCSIWRGNRWRPSPTATAILLFIYLFQSFIYKTSYMEDNTIACKNNIGVSKVYCHTTLKTPFPVRSQTPLSNTIHSKRWSSVSPLPSPPICPEMSTALRSRASLKIHVYGHIRRQKCRHARAFSIKIGAKTCKTAPKDIVKQRRNP